MDSRIKKHEEKQGKEQIKNPEKVLASIRKEKPRIETIADIRNEKARKKLVDILLEHGIKYIKLGHRDTMIAKNARTTIREKLKEALSEFGIAELGDVFLNTMRAGISTYSTEGIRSLMGRDSGQTGLLNMQLQKTLAECAFLKKAISKKSLDFGCGIGWFANMMKKEYGTESYGVDINLNMIALGKFFGIKNLIHVDEKEYRLPFPDEFFDSVFSINSLFGDRILETEPNEHILKEIARVTKPFGALLISSVDATKYFYGRWNEIMNEELGEAGFTFAHADKEDVGWGVWLKI